MQKLFFSKIFFLIFSTIGIVFAVYITSRVDFIHGFVFEKNTFLLFPYKLMRIEPLHYMASLLQSLTVVALFSIACISFGVFLIWRLVENKGSMEQITLSAWVAIVCTAFVAGSAVFSIIFISLGALYKFSAAFLIPIILAGFIIGIPFVRKLFSLLPPNKKIKLNELFNGKDYQLMFVLVIVIIFLCLMYSSSRLSFDAVAFYFSDEKITALTNHLQFFQNNVFAASSFQAGIAYAVLIKISGEQAARIYTWVNGLVIIFFAVAIGEKIGLSKQARLIALILLLTSTAFLDLTGDGKVELISTTAVLASLYWTISNSDKKLNAVSFLVGSLAGLAVGSRIYNAFLVCSFIGIYSAVKIYSNKGKGISTFLKSLLWIGLGFFCLMVIHLFINWVILGYPFAFVKNLQGVDSADKWHWTIPPDYLWAIRLLYPLSVTFINIPQSNGNISPLFLCGLVGILTGIAKSKIKMTTPLIEIIIATVVTLGIWICTSYTVFEIRYVLFLWILLFMPMAMVIESFLTLYDLLLKRFMQFALIFLLFFTAIRTIFLSIDTYSPTDNLGDSHCSEYSFCDPLQPLNDTAPLGSRVLALNAFKYYLRSDLFMCLSKHEEYSILQSLSFKDQDAFWLEVYRQGYQYIAYEEIYSSLHLKFGIRPDPNETPIWLTLKPIYGKPDDSAVTYQIQVKNPPIESRTVCKQTPEAIWEVQYIK